MRALPPSLRSIWLVFHVLFAKLAAGAWLLSVASAVTFLRKTSGATGRWIDRLPAPGALEAYIVRFIGFGFVAWTVSVVAGAIWANQSWGRYWAWDSIETWSLVTWLCYGTFLHAHRFLKLQARATAWAAIGCGLIVVATIFVLPDLLPGLHGAYFQ
jgi:ABC-type transport system involved in cytochrome c biogenesis permease subunit